MSEPDGVVCAPVPWYIRMGRAALALYRCKDVVEKALSMLKNDIEALPLNVRKDSAVAGLLFVCFLSLILRMRSLRRLKESGLNKKYSIEGLLTELENLRIMILPDGTRIPTKIIKRQRDIIPTLYSFFLCLMQWENRLKCSAFFGILRPLYMLQIKRVRKKGRSSPLITRPWRDV